MQPRSISPLAFSILALAGTALLLLLSVPGGASAGAFTPSPAPAVIEPDPDVQWMIGQVTSATLYQYTGDLSGEWPAELRGEPVVLSSRYTYSGEPIRQATQLVGDHLAALGLDVEYHVWGGAGYPNVIGELPGLTRPDEIYILSAHLDTMPSGAISPGADDNASGSAAVLLAADILSQFRWDCTLRFALWTGEEQWMLGSYAYAERAYNTGEDIRGVLNLDMIGWNTPDSSVDMDMEAEPSIPFSLVMADMLSDVISAYDLDLIPAVRYGGAGDHIAFWAYGYPAILAIEDLEDFNPRYHTRQERLHYLDMPYFADLTRAGVGTFAHLANCLVRDGRGAVEGHVTSAGSGLPVDGATLSFSSPSGRTLQVTADAAGYFTRTLVAAGYTATVSAYGYLSQTVDLAVVSGTVTGLDFALQAAPSYVVSGTLLEAGTGLPLAGRVSFVGTPVAVPSDPATGFFQALVAEGRYTLHAEAARHRPTEFPVVIDHDQVHNMDLERLPCVLLVDDDANGPDVQSYYTTALDRLGVSYDLWTVGAGGDPPLAALPGYRAVVWFTGYPWSMTLNTLNDAVLGDYLDRGGRLFLSSEDYLFEAGLTHLGQSYLGIAGYTGNVGRADPVGNDGHPAGEGLGPYTLVAPPGWGALRTDRVEGAQGSPFRWQGTGQNNSAALETAAYRTVFLGWPLEGLAAAGDRADVLGASLDWFGGCLDRGYLAGQITDAVTGAPLAGATVAAGDTQATTGPSGTYTLSLAFGRHDVVVDRTDYYSQTFPDLLVQAGLTTTLDVALVPRPCVPITGTTLTWEPLNPTVGAAVIFSGVTSGTSPVTYTWTFGDGETAAGRVVTHRFAHVGTYTVTLTATNACGTAAAGERIAVLPARVYMPLLWRR